MHFKWSSTLTFTFERGIIYVLWWLWIGISSLTNGFNMDVEYPVIYKYPGIGEAYFGYSVSLHWNSDGAWLLVGAPRGNRSLVPQLKEPGTLYKCKLFEKSCTEIEIDPRGNNADAVMYKKYQKSSPYWEKKDEGWLGVSLDVNYETGHVATCAHRWINQYQYKSDKRHDYYANGACYRMTEDLQPNSAELLLPLVDDGMQVDQNYKSGLYAFGMAGISAHFTKQGSNLLLGAPGLDNWIGGLASFNNQPRKEKFNVVQLSRTNAKDYAFMYFGYAVSSVLVANDQQTYYLIGAPRHRYVGAVFSVNSGIGPGVKDLQPFKVGFQLGEYFGAALCATDINNDGLADVIVGAPFHATKWDEGIAYVYMNDDVTKFTRPPEKLHGSNVAGARFGMAISCLDDINFDDLNDVAIGAPYENGYGAVYIYYGKKTKPYLDNVQRIEASTIDRSLRGFGISLSRGRDIDSNNYPDLAVGSYSSGHAVIFRGRPIVYLIGLLEPLPNKISIMNPQCQHNGQKVRCFNVKACIYYTSPKWKGLLPVSTTLSVDPMQHAENPRGNFFIENKLKSEIQNNVSLYTPAPVCKIYSVYIRENVKNYLLPITIRMEFNLNLEKTNNFCKECPVLHPSSLRSIQKQVLFLKGCGSDEKCHSDLKLTVSVLYNKAVTVPEILRGLNQSLSFNINVENFKDAAFLTELNITFPEWSYVLRKPPPCVDLAAGGRRGNTLICDVGNPLHKGKIVTMELAINVQDVPSTASHFGVFFEVITASEEAQEDRHDNIVSFNVAVKTQADIHIWGRASDEFFNNYSSMSPGQGLKFSHNYEVRNWGPSSLPKVAMTLKVPYQSTKLKFEFLNITNMKAYDGNRGAQVSNCKGADVWHFLDDGTPRNQLIVPDQVRRKRQAKSSTSSNHITLSPQSTSSCHITCDIISIAANESIKIEMEFMLYPSVLREMQIIDKSVDYVTSGHVTIPDLHNIQPEVHKPDDAQVTTTFDSGKFAQEELPDWVVPVSIIAGIILLALIFLIFYKVGFFKRAERDKLQQMKRESMVHARSSGAGPEPQYHNSTNQVIDAEAAPQPIS